MLYPFKPLINSGYIVGKGEKKGGNEGSPDCEIWRLEGGEKEKKEGKERDESSNLSADLQDQTTATKGERGKVLEALTGLQKRGEKKKRRKGKAVI